MAMRKAEMEDHAVRYRARMCAAEAAASQQDYRAAINVAVLAWENIDGMMQYVRKFEERELDSISSIELVLTYAPVILDLQSLTLLERLLDDCKRIERGTPEDLRAKLALSRAKLWDNHRLWAHLQTYAVIRQDELRTCLGGNQDQWRSIVTLWAKMGLLTRTADGGSYLLALATRMDQAVPANCPSCGFAIEAPKRDLLTKKMCPKCQACVVFVLLAPRKTSPAEE